MASASSADSWDWPVVGELAPMRELRVIDAIDTLGPAILVVHDPPWATLAPAVGAVDRVVFAERVDLPTLESLAASAPERDVTVVGIGGGTALDTAKYLAWTWHSPLVLAPTVLSVDAAFTETAGVRDDARVRYVGSADPELVVLDTALIRAAPPRLNRAGAGDILSCHTALWDWQRASERGLDEPWRADLAALATALLGDLAARVDEVARVSLDGVRFLAAALRAIGAACRAAGHARFEEGSEHFLAYALEARTGVRTLHGELIAMCVVAVAALQENDLEYAVDVIERAGLRAHPDDLGFTRHDVVDSLLGLRDYARSEHLWHGVADFVDITPARAARAWDVIAALARRT